MHEELTSAMETVKEASRALEHSRTRPDPGTPEIVAIFEQLKHLRECDRSLRSLRHTYELDNMPSFEDPEPAAEPAQPLAGDLHQVLDAYVRLQREKELLEVRVDRLTHLVEELSERIARIERD